MRNYYIESDLPWQGGRFTAINDYAAITMLIEYTNFRHIARLFRGNKGDFPPRQIKEIRR